MLIKYVSRSSIVMGLVTVVVAGFSAAPLFAQQPMQAQMQFSATRPIKISISSDRASVRVGQTVKLTVGLLDDDNRLANATNETIISLDTTQPSGRVDKRDVTVPAGQSSQLVTLTLTEPGIVEVQAHSSQYRDGGTFLKVVRTRSHIKALPQAPMRIKRQGLVNRDSIGSGVGPTVSTAMPAGPPVDIRDSIGAPSPVEDGAGTPESAGPATLPTAAAVTSDGGGPVVGAVPIPTILLRYAPHRTILADGKDSAQLRVFLDQPAPQDITVRFDSSGGKLEPSRIVIKKGDDAGACQLTSIDKGDVHVQYVGPTPGATFTPGEPKDLTIKFGPPIMRFVLKTSPPGISLLDRSTVLVQLLDENKRPVETDVERHIALEIDKGAGDIDPLEVSIKPGHFDGHARFTPSWTGSVAVSASTPEMESERTVVTVTVPILLLALSALGGLIGGWIAFVTGKDGKAGWWRVVAGAFCGFVFYWSSLGLLHLTAPAVSILNPIGTFGMSVLGGWVGPTIFDEILKRFGIGKKKEGEAGRSLFSANFRFAFGGKKDKEAVDGPDVEATLNFGGSESGEEKSKGSGSGEDV